MGLFGGKDIEIEINTNTHLLILDQKWHALFKDKKPMKVQSLEKELNNLLKKQGTCNTELKEYSELKKKMMDEIVNSMKEAYDEKDKKALKQMEKNKSYIDQINKKLEHHQKELTSLPEKINDVNKKLVTVTMNHFYFSMVENRDSADKLEEKVTELKAEISETIIKRDEAKEEYHKLYGYIHDVVGADVIEQYDKAYAGDKND